MSLAMGVGVAAAPVCRSVHPCVRGGLIVLQESSMFDVPSSYQAHCLLGTQQYTVVVDQWPSSREVQKACPCTKITRELSLATRWGDRLDGPRATDEAGTFSRATMLSAARVAACTAAAARTSAQHTARPSPTRRHAARRARDS